MRKIFIGLCSVLLIGSFAFCQEQTPQQQVQQQSSVPIEVRLKVAEDRVTFLKSQVAQNPKDDVLKKELEKAEADYAELKRREQTIKFRQEQRKQERELNVIQRMMRAL